jgi:ribonuclease P protein component
MKSLKSKTVIDELFATGKKSYNKTVNGRFLPGEPEVLISVPIRLFKKAVDRNRIKRMMRESARKYENKGYFIALIYNSDKIEDFKTIDNNIKTIFDNLK